MVPRRGDLNSQTALRVLALVLMSGHCRGGSKMPLQSRPITAMWANMELGLAGWMASSWPILDSKLPAGAPSVFVSSTPCCTATCPSLGYER